MTTSDDTDGWRGVWLETVAAVDHVAAFTRPDLTVWDALEEALGRWLTDRLTPPAERPTAAATQTVLPWDDPDPLRSTLEQLLAAVPAAGAVDGQRLAVVFASALEQWVNDAAVVHNDGFGFAHPAPSSGWPPPTAGPGGGSLKV